LWVAALGVVVLLRPIRTPMTAVEASAGIPPPSTPP
jgi:hypothetical protein